MQGWLLAFFAFAALGAPPEIPAPREGFVPVPGGPAWYKVVGQGRGTPLLVVHGGPGGRSCFFEPLAERLGRERPVILYDQLGSGRSGRPQDPDLWTPQRFALEITAIRSALGLREIHLLGYSWGAAVVLEHLAHHPREGIISVVLGSPFVSTRLWLEDAAVLRSQLPLEVQKTLERHERAGTTDNPEYEAAAAVFDRQYGARLAPYHIPSCEGSSMNREIYRRMWGPNEFFPTGSLKSFDRSSTLKTLRMPVLFTCGRMDEVRTETLAYLQGLTPRSEVVVLERTGHMAMVEEADAYAGALRSFLSRSETPGKQ